MISISTVLLLSMMCSTSLLRAVHVEGRLLVDRPRLCDGWRGAHVQAVHARVVRLATELVVITLANTPSWDHLLFGTLSQSLEA